MQVFAGHVSPVVCGEFTPDGLWPGTFIVPLTMFSFHS